MVTSGQQLLHQLARSLPLSASCEGTHQSGAALVAEGHGASQTPRGATGEPKQFRCFGVCKSKL